MPLGHYNKPPRGSDLSPREHEVLQLLAQGYSHKAIARTLGITPGTASNHNKWMRYRLDARTIGHAVAIGYKRGLIVSDEHKSEDGQRLEMVRCLLPHSTVVVPTAGLYYHVQRMIEEHHGGPFRKETRIVTINNRGHADALRGVDRIFFDPACDGDLGSNVAMAEMRRARDMAHVLNRLAAE